MPAEDAVFVLNLSNEKDPCCFPVSDGAGWSGVRRNDAPSSSPPSSSPWPGLKIGSRTKLERRATAEMVSVLVRGQLKPHASTLCVLKIGRMKKLLVAGLFLLVLSGSAIAGTKHHRPPKPLHKKSHVVRFRAPSRCRRGARASGSLSSCCWCSPAVGELLSRSFSPLQFFNPVFFLLLVGLYGCGALLVRETAARRQLNGAGILLLGAAYGIIEEGLTCKSFFNPY